MMMEWCAARVWEAKGFMYGMWWCSAASGLIIHADGSASRRSCQSEMQAESETRERDRRPICEDMGGGRVLTEPIRAPPMSSVVSRSPPAFAAQCGF